MCISDKIESINLNTYLDKVEWVTLEIVHQQSIQKNQDTQIDIKYRIYVKMILFFIEEVAPREGMQRRQTHTNLCYWKVQHKHMRLLPEQITHFNKLGLFKKKNLSSLTNTGFRGVETMVIYKPPYPIG
jgi:hypothetical protein